MIREQSIRARVRMLISHGMTCINVCVFLLIVLITLINGFLIVGLNRIPLVTAAQMINKTTPIPNNPGYFVSELSVFHQLHCLVCFRLSACRTVR